MANIRAAIAKKCTLVKEEYLSYTRQEKIFLFLMLLCSFFIMIDYSIVKPVSNSVFLTHCSASSYPYAWLCALPLNFLLVTFYNRVVPKIGCFRMFLCLSFLALSINLTAAFWIAEIPFFPFFFYLWKDIYIMLMLQQLWAVVHSTTTKITRAKYLYGIVFGVGTFGSSLGSLLSSYFSVRWGTEHLLLLTLPVYFLLGMAYYWLVRTSVLDQKNPVKPSKGACDFRLILTSRPLQFILATVVFMQISTTIMDYRFHSFLEIEIPDQDVRTQFSSQVWAIINSANLVLQFFATFLLVHVLGIRRSQFFLPLVLLGNTAGCLLYPGFRMVSYAFGTVKVFDYSIFNIIKEMLYVPLTKEEKFKARALIDVFAYRTSKALASIAILAMQIFFPFQLSMMLIWIVFLLYILWLVSVYVFTKRVDLVPASDTN